MLGGLFVGLGIIIAPVREGSCANNSKPTRIISFETKRDPEVSLNAIVRFAQNANYKVVTLEQENGHVVRGVGDSHFLEFLFSVVVKAQSETYTHIEVGIKSELVQVGTTVSRSHERCFKGMKVAVFAE